MFEGVKTAKDICIKKILFRQELCNFHKNVFPRILKISERNWTENLVTLGLE